MNIILAPLSWLYFAVTQLRVLAYKFGLCRPQRLPGKTISIGNIEVGGTGKTPVTIALAQALKARGYTPAILTRGYRSGLSANDSAVLCGDQELLPSLQGLQYSADEARLQAQTLIDVPVIVGSKRYQAAQRYLQHFTAPSHWLLDDGFQHLQLARDLNLVLIDAQSQPSAAHLLPRGRLREPLRALRRADQLLLTRGHLHAMRRADQEALLQWEKAIIQVPIVSTAPSLRAGSALAGAILKSGKILVAAAIARPERILPELATFGIVPAATHFIADHCHLELRAADLADYVAVIVTAKDWARDEASLSLLGLPIYVIDVIATLDAATLEQLLGS